MNTSQTISRILNPLVGGWRLLAGQLSRRPGILEQFPPRPMKLPARYHADAKPLPEPPKISIVTPSYNQGKYLERTLESVLGQNYQPLEFIVQDGGSTDESPKILALFRSASPRGIGQGPRPDPCAQPGVPPFDRQYPGVSQFRRFAFARGLALRGSILRRASAC